MLDSKTIKSVNDFVHKKPRTVQEIATLIGKNWRTADKYVSWISKETGSLSVRTFRQGTRGALKIVYWNSLENIHSTELQEKLLKRIENRSRKHEFSPFDFYQYVVPENRSATMLDGDQDFMRNHLEKAGSQVLSFSGNLSWINSKEKGKKLLAVVESLVKRGVSIKVLCRVTIDSINNVKALLLLNKKLGKNLVEIRHSEIPLRGFIIDNTTARFREYRDLSNYKRGELDKSVTLFYEIFEPEWIEWIQKMFWYFFRTSTPAEKRIQDLESIRNVYKI